MTCIVLAYSCVSPGAAPDLTPCQEYASTIQVIRTQASSWSLTTHSLLSSTTVTVLVASSEVTEISALLLSLSVSLSSLSSLPASSASGGGRQTHGPGGHC